MSIYWILTFVPELVIYITLAIGLIGLFVATFINKITFIKTYALPIKIVSFILAAIGLYLSGAVAYKHSMAVEVAELREKLAKAEAEGERVNTQIVEKVMTQTQVIREKGRTITEYVDREIPQYDDQCVLPNEVINAHNMAATLTVPSENEE
jgi:uncharacterized protein YacL